MGLTRKHNLTTVKLNPSQIFALFSLPFTYDVQQIAINFTRLTVPAAYEVSFDDYIRFILLETVQKPKASYVTKYSNSHENATFLASDARLNEHARKVSILMNSLGDGKLETLKNRNFSTISSVIKESLFIMFENFLLNMTVLQTKLVEFQRWGTNVDSYVPYVVPTLGVFSSLLNMKNIHMDIVEDEDTGLFIPTTLEYLSEFQVPSNIKVGELEAKACEEIYNGVEVPSILISDYAYQGIYKHTIPTGYYITKEKLAVLDSKVKAIEKYELAYEKCKSELQKLIIQQNKHNLPREVFIAQAIQEVAEGRAKGERVKSAMSNLVEHYTQLQVFEQGIDKPEELTEKEKADKIIVDALREKPYWKDRYPQYTYDQLVTKIFNKYDSGEELIPLEQSILEVEDYTRLLTGILEMFTYFYHEKDELCLMVPKIQKTDIPDEDLSEIKVWQFYSNLIVD